MRLASHQNCLVRHGLLQILSETEILALSGRHCFPPDSPDHRPPVSGHLQPRGIKRRVDQELEFSGLPYLQAWTSLSVARSLANLSNRKRGWKKRGRPSVSSVDRFLCHTGDTGWKCSLGNSVQVAVVWKVVFVRTAWDWER